MAKTKFVCKLCRCDVKLTKDGWRHANSPWDDGSGFCDRYGYPTEAIEVNDNEVEAKDL